MTIKVFPLGDSAAVIEFAWENRDATLSRVAAFAERLAAHAPQGIVEWVPAFSTVTVFYDPLKFVSINNHTSVKAERILESDSSPAFESLRNRLLPLLEEVESVAALPPREVVLPVCYGGEHGLDLGFVADYHAATPEQIIERHVAGEYRVQMIGFAPGFPYLSGLSPSLTTPRLPSPRTRVPCGSVGIGGRQTGIYSVASPGGWRIIGCTPVRLFRPESREPSLLRAGDTVRFRRIGEEEFAELREVIESPA